MNRLLGVLLLSASALHAQVPSVAVPDGVIADGVPAIPATLPAAVRRYTEGRSAGFVDWHPVRREMFIRTRFGNVAQLHHVRAPGGARRQLTFFAEPIGAASIDQRDGASAVITLDRGGDEYFQLHRLDLATGDTVRLTDGGRTQSGGATWSRDGARIAFASTMRNGVDRDIWVMDPRDTASRRLVMQVQGGGWGVGGWLPDGSGLLVGQGISVERTRIWRVNLAGGAPALLLPRDTTPGTPDADATYGVAGIAPDGRSAFVVTDRGGEFRRLARLDLASGVLTDIAVGAKGDVEGVALSHDGRRLAFTVNEAGPSGLHLLDVASGKVTRIAQLPVGLVGGLRWHRNGRDLGFTLSSARSPGDAWSLDAESRVLTRWTESEVGGIPMAELPEAEVVRWTSFDGLEISGLLHRPPARFGGRRPVIIDIHGGPEGQARPAFLGRDAYWLLELGAVIIEPNVRGSTGFGRRFVSLDNGVRREDAVRDIGALLDWIATQPTLDPTRVMVTGGSYGGYMTLAVATQYDARICCSVDIVGISNLVTFLENTAAYRRDQRRVEYGDERDPEMRAVMERTAPLNNAARISRPLLVIQGANDPRVPRTEADQMVAAVRRSGGEVWYVLGMEGGHGAARKAQADYEFHVTVEFARRHLLGGGVP
ncbi:MAG: prolyl oligopeptidase family serine peptidase [Gemmatimonadales bacterium]|nr:prolyl oligopeptidase family serine peptidase [Gemmatimonadales bacterium]